MSFLGLLEDFADFIFGVDKKKKEEYQRRKTKVEETTIYVIQCQHCKYYVGKSKDVEKRYASHVSGSGCLWTKEHPPIRICHTHKETSSYDEYNTTLEYMSKYGVDNVRGGPYCSLKLTEYQIRDINGILRSVEDRCYKCGEKGHISTHCIATRCLRCGRNNHTVENCYATTFVR